MTTKLKLKLIKQYLRGRARRIERAIRKDQERRRRNCTSGHCVQGTFDYRRTAQRRANGIKIINGRAERNAKR